MIDLGCGPRGILDLLAERVSPAGRVVGLDTDPAHTAMAAEFAARRGLSGVEVITADAGRTGLPPASFDLVHTRTLLVNLPEPATVAKDVVDAAVREYIENHRDEINAGVREALAQLDGTKGGVVSMLTGFDAAKLAELGGIGESPINGD